MTTPSNCVILVPTQEPIDRECEENLRQLEQAGWIVRHSHEKTSLDISRNRLATDALADGFETLVWIDPDILFDPADLETLHTHHIPFVCGLYPVIGAREFACVFLPNTQSITLGQQGGLVELRYVGLGFAVTHRAVFDAIRERFQLPVCDERFGRSVIPYFSPLAVKDGAGVWYLSGDYAFCERARQCGIRITADTTIRLWRVGRYRYSWEEAGSSPERFASYLFQLPVHRDPAAASTAPVTPIDSVAGGYRKVAPKVINTAEFDQPPVDGANPQRYIVCCTQRSGSFLLLRQLLNAGIGVPHEYFHPLHLGSLADRWGINRTDRRSYLETLVRHRTTPNRVWGTKLQWWQYTQWREEIDQLVQAGAKLIYLYRAQVAAQAVSLHLAHVTGIWGFDGEKTTAGQPAKRLHDLAGVRECERTILSDNRHWEAFFRQHQVEPLAICYEDLIADQASTVRQIAAFLGLPQDDYRTPPSEPHHVVLPPEVQAAQGELLQSYLPLRPEEFAGEGAASRPSSPFRMPRRHPLRGAATPLASGFPRFRAYAVTYPANIESLRLTQEDFRHSDWGEELIVFVQPEDWPRGKESASRNYKRALEHAAEDGCDFALILEDDVRVSRWLRHNLSTIPLITRDQCDYFSLFMPDLIRDPWDREEPHLGYRLSRPLYSGPNRLWTKHRLWGSQAYLLSRRLVLAALERWDRLKEGQDTRVITLCSQFKLPMWYPAPCLIEHAPLRTAFGTPPVYAPDFNRDFRLELRAGFQPPEEIPGWLAYDEAKLLWEIASGQDVLELGTAAGRSTVCLAQQAHRVTSIDHADQSEAQIWVRRYGLAERVVFRQGDVGDVCRHLAGQFDLIFVDTEHDAPSVTRDIEAARSLIRPGGRIAFHDYPDPSWPDVRRVVDDQARRYRWNRVAQRGYVGVFQIPPT